MPACRVMCAGECIGHAGVQMGKWSVHEVRVVQSASTVTFAGRSQQRRERVDGAAAPVLFASEVVGPITAYGPSTSPFLPGMIVGRRPKAKSDEFGDVDTLGTPVLRYKGVVLFFIKDFTGCVTLIGSTTLCRLF